MDIVRYFWTKHQTGHVSVSDIKKDAKEEVSHYRCGHRGFDLVILEKDPPSPAVQDLHVFVISILLAGLELGTQPLHAFGHRPGYPERYFFGEDMEDCEHEEGKRCESSFAMDRVSDTGQQGPTLAKGIFRVV